MLTSMLSSFKVVEAVQRVEDPHAFEALLQDAAKADELVVVDFFSQKGCAHCTTAVPHFTAMATELRGKGVRFVKFDCGKDVHNKKWALRNQVLALPTFRVYQPSRAAGPAAHVGQVVGSTKFDVLRSLVEAHRHRADATDV